MDIVEEIPGLLATKSDGSVVRWDIQTPSLPANENFIDGVKSKDVNIDHATDVKVRIFVPYIDDQSQNIKLPVIVYVHGGGFCMCSAGTAFFHTYCSQMAITLKALVVSVDYRLAPENRLPAAYEDCASAIHWLSLHAQDFLQGKTQEQQIQQRPELDPWISQLANLSEVFLMGESVGANILHHVMLRSKTMWKPLTILGLILVTPFFGSQERCASEVSCKDDLVVPMEMCDELWKFSLPLNANRDHPFSNPFSPQLPNLSEVVLPPILLVLAGNDPLRDRQCKYYEYLKETGKEVFLLFLRDAVHGFEFVATYVDQNKLMLKCIQRFMRGSK